MNEMRKDKMRRDGSRWLSLAGAAGIGLVAVVLAACGTSRAPGAGRAEGPLTAGPAAADPLQAQLLAGLGGSAGPAGSVRAGSAMEFEIAGSGFARWSAAPSQAAPDNPDAVRLIAAAPASMAYAAYALPPLAFNYGGLPKRVRVSIRPAPAGQALPPAPLEYYVGVSDYTTTRWDWRGPFSSSYTLQLNADALRQRCFDRNGATTVVVALRPGAGGPRAADVLSVGFDTSGQYYPVKPYRPALADATLSSELVEGWAGGIPAVNTLAYAPGAGIPPFNELGFADIDMYRQTGQQQLLVATRSTFPLNGGFTLRDALDAPGGSAVEPPAPLATYSYSLRLRNAAGETAPTDPRELTTLFAVPEWGQVQSEIGGVSLLWRSQRGPAQYELYRDGALLATFGAEEFFYVDHDVQPGVEHSYQVRAVLGSAVRENEIRACAADIAAPEITRAQPGTDGIVLEWAAPGYAGLELYRDNVLIAAPPAGATTYTDAAAVPGELHEYRVRGLYAAGLFKDSAAVSELRWTWPRYLLPPGLGANGGQLADLGGHPGLMTGCTHGAAASFSLYEAVTAQPQSATEWTLSTHELPGLEPQPEAQGLGDPGDRHNFCSVLGQPACALTSAFASFNDFDIALSYRQQNQLPPLPPELLEWRQAWCPTQSILTSLSLATVAGRPALAWRDEFTLRASYARATTLEPESRADWQVSQVSVSGATKVQLGSVGLLPVLLACDSNGQVAFYQGLNSTPGGPTDWSRIALDPSGFPVALATLGGTACVVYQHDSDLYFARALTATPAGPADFASSMLLADAAGTDVRLAEVNGRPVALCQAPSGHCRLLLAAGPQPAGPADWTALGIDAHAAGADLVVSGGQPLLAYHSSDQRRDSGWYIVLPPAGL